jgi:hypothetical protein
MSKIKCKRLIALLSIAALLSIGILSSTTSALVSQNITSWYWTSDTNASAIAIGDVNGDGQTDIVSGGYYNDGIHWNGQLIVWDASNLVAQKVTGWNWNDTQVSSVGVGDVDADGGKEIVTGGAFFDGTRWVAQLIVWNGSTLVAERVTAWYWTSNTQISSVAIANITGGSALDIVTGGAFFDGTRWVAQLIVWNGSTLVAEKITAWYWTSNTYINSLAVANVTGGASLDIVTGGSFFDSTRAVAQLIVWNGSTLVAEKITAWYWTSNTYVNSVAVANLTGGATPDIVTGGSYYDGSRSNAQVIVWDSATLSASSIATWFVTSETSVSSLAISEIGLTGNRVVTGGSYSDGLRGNAQITVWV